MLAIDFVVKSGSGFLRLTGVSGKEPFGLQCRAHILCSAVTQV
jgi:hypothetical protein